RLCSLLKGSLMRMTRRSVHSVLCVIRPWKPMWRSADRVTKTIPRGPALPKKWPSRIRRRPDGECGEVGQTVWRSWKASDENGVAVDWKGGCWFRCQSQGEQVH